MLVMQANGMVSHSAPGPTEPVRSAAPLCIPVVGKVQLNSRLQRLLQRSNELDRLQAIQQRVSMEGAGDQSAKDLLRRGQGGLLGASAALTRPSPAVPSRPANGQLREVPPSAVSTLPHVVSAAGDGLPFKKSRPEPAQPLPAAFAISSTSHQKILPKPVPQSAASAEPPINYKVEKIKSKHKGPKTAAKHRVDMPSSNAKSRSTAKMNSNERRPVSKASPAEARGARPRVKSSVACPAAPRLPSLPVELRAYQAASRQELAGRRPLLPSPADCPELQSAEGDSEPEPEGVPSAARRYRERRRFSRCCRLLVAELRRSGGEAAARLCGRLLRPPQAAADSERGRRLRARQRLEARRLLAALQEARDRRTELSERARLAPLLAGAAAAYPSRTGQLLLRPELEAGQHPPAPVSRRAAQLVRRPCCHRGADGPCRLTALPCTRHCARHILYNVDQLLFQHCTAKFSDNTQCCVPVFDIKHELPLCEEHARKRDNYEKMAGRPRSEPKKKSRSIKRPKRRKKTKKKTAPRESTSADRNRQESYEDGSFGEMEPDLPDEEDDEDEDDEELEDEEDDEDCAGRQSGELERSLELHLGTVLENEFSEVLSKLPDEAFTELFADPHAGDLVHKETEELERALEAVEREADQSQAGKPEPPAAAAAAPRQHVLNGNPSLGGSAEMEESVYSQLAQGISLEHAISSVLNGQEMNTLSQLLTHLGDSVIQDADSAAVSAS